MNEYLSYQDVFLIPEYSDFHSRDEAGTLVSLGDRAFRLPVVPANMKCVIDTGLSKWLSENGYFYIMHRFNKNHEDAPNHDNWEFVKKANEEKWKTISISVGVQHHDLMFLEKCMFSGYRIDFVTIDIAHAHSIRMKDMLNTLRSMYHMEVPEGADCDRSSNASPFVIAGNVATPEAVRDLEEWGADAVKVGIAQGGACTTYGMTGFGAPMFSCMLECAAVAKKPLIADGGIRTNGDIAKAIVAGGTMVMAGSIFAACKDAPGENIYSHGLSPDGRYFQEDKSNITKKIYYGSASEYNKGSKRHVEGTKLELSCNGMTYEEKYQEIADSYTSSVSYAGGNLLNVKWGIKRS